MTRVILGIRKNGNIIRPKFSECILDYFTKSNSTTVDCTSEGDLIILKQDKTGPKLQHSPECPIRVLSQTGVTNQADDIKQEKKVLDINIAVSVIIESSDHHVLLTRRPSHMRSSPRVWVPPGGHLELGESLLEGAIREVEEETSLNIADGKPSLLCLWENVYPIMLGFGPPSSHLLVVYYHVLMNENHEKLQATISLDPEEVESCCWLSAETISKLFKDMKTKNQKQYVLENGKIIEKTLDPNNMFNKFFMMSSQSYTGTQYALRNWLENYFSNDVLQSKF